MKITCKTILLPPSTPCTVLHIRVPENDPAFGIYVAKLARDSTEGQVNWGDGTIETVLGIDSLVHEYSRPGTYDVVLSDDFQSIGFGANPSKSDFSSRFGPCILTMRTTAQQLAGFATYSFYHCENLTEIDYTGSGVYILVAYSYHGCTGLGPRIDLPSIQNVNGTRVTVPFIGCPNIEEIHFSEANAAAVQKSSGYVADRTLGTGKAVCSFDLK